MLSSIYRSIAARLPQVLSISAVPCTEPGSYCRAPHTWPGSLRESPWERHWPPAEAWVRAKKNH